MGLGFHHIWDAKLFLNKGQKNFLRNKHAPPVFSKQRSGPCVCAADPFQRKAPSCFRWLHKSITPNLTNANKQSSGGSPAIGPSRARAPAFLESSEFLCLKSCDLRQVKSSRDFIEIRPCPKLTSCYIKEMRHPRGAPTKTLPFSWNLIGCRSGCCRVPVRRQARGNPTLTYKRPPRSDESVQSDRQSQSA